MAQPIARAARIRAAILAFLPKAVEAVTIKQINDHPALRELDATIPQTTSVVLDLNKRGILRRIHTSRKEEPNTKYAYEVVPGPPQPTPAAKTVKQNSGATLPPDVRLDIIKSTGRLRIEFRGLRVEIGTID